MTPKLSVRKTGSSSNRPIQHHVAHISVLLEDHDREWHALISHPINLA